ncbi:MAG: thioesterase family protein [Spirochaetaceae bacterium]|nr:thioesterase family protein [Spirochaetaceae bacterium]HPG27220.1 thioesterase family protein [Myxococcota bacterium]
MDKATASDALFLPDPADPTRFEATAYTGGPWNPTHQHGGAVSGLLTRAMNRAPAPVPMRLARMTIEMFRGVPVARLRVETRVVRGGRRIQSVEAGIFADDTLVARATGLRIRVDEALAELGTPIPLDPALGQPPDPVPERFRTLSGVTIPGFVHAVDIVTEGASVCGEPVNLWTRLRCPLVAGEAIDPVERLATLVDFASGTGNAMDYTRFTAINPDLSIHVLREPRSDWIGVRGVSLRSGDGIGQSAAWIHDLEGPVARVQASLLLDRRALTPPTDPGSADAQNG